MGGLAADRMTLDVLDQDVAGGATVDGDLDHLCSVRERVTEHARIDREVLRVLAAAVDDAGDEAVATQPPRGARAVRITGPESERRGFGGGHETADDGSERRLSFGAQGYPRVHES